MPLSRGECGRSGQQEKDRQRLLRPSGPMFAVNRAKNRLDDVQGSAGGFVTIYFRDFKQLMREKEKR